MKRNLLLISAVVAALVSLPAAAQRGYDDRYAPPPDVRAVENVSFAYADVLRVDPIYDQVAGEPREECYDERVVHQEPRGGDPTGGTILGAIVGGALGNQVGKGDGRKAATIAGALVGGAVGRNIDKNDGSGRSYGGTERRCRLVDDGFRREVVAYDVEYRYRGEVYMSRLDYNPGDRLRVRVSVAPAE